MQLILRRDEGTVGFILAAFGSISAHILECDSGIGFVDGVECSLVSDVLFRDERDSAPFMVRFVMFQ